MTWNQVKKRTQEAEKLVVIQGLLNTPETIFTSMVTIITCTICISTVSGKEDSCT